MKETLISFETAKLAKEKGFDIKCVDLWYYKPGYSESPDLHRGTTLHRRYINCSNFYGGCNTSDYEESMITIEDLLRTPSDYPAESSLYLAPTQSLLQKWLREVHGLHIELFLTSSSTWSVRSIVDFKNGYNGDYMPHTDKFYNTYEEALEEGLQEALKLIPNK